MCLFVVQFEVFALSFILQKIHWIIKLLKMLFHFAEMENAERGLLAVGNN